MKRAVVIPEATIGPKTWLQHFWYAIIRLLGWRYAGDLPTAPKYVMIVAPHTSTWDFFLGIGASWACDIPQLHWIGKHTIFRGPIGTLLRAMGGIPLNRTASRDFVQQVAYEFIRRDALIIALAPEGTRSLTKYWKSGFYYLAWNAQVPICMVALDYSRKVFTLSPLFALSGDVEIDMMHIRDFYGKYGRGGNPEKQGAVRLRPNIHAKMRH